MLRSEVVKTNDGITEGKKKIKYSNKIVQQLKKLEKKTSRCQNYG